MSKHLNNVLPIEILENIFQNLNITRMSKDKKNPVYLYARLGDMSIRVDEDSLERLSKDIVSFAQKASSIRLVESRSRGVDRTAAGLIWFDIILACPNLISIIFLSIMILAMYDA